MTDFRSLSPLELAPYIQHTLIAVGTTRDQAEEHARQAIEYSFDAALVAGSWGELTARILEGPATKVASAPDFPTVGGLSNTGQPAAAAGLGRLGAREID